MSAPPVRDLWRAARAVGGRPDLWPAAVVMAWRLAPQGWWRHWPPLPLPDAAYWRFRMTTAYGGAGNAAAAPADVVEYLEWCSTRRRRVRPPLR